MRKAAVMKQETLCMLEPLCHPLQRVTGVANTCDADNHTAYSEYVNTVRSFRRRYARVYGLHECPARI